MAGTYRNWLQTLANQGNSDAQLALDYQGDDGNIDQGRVDSNFAYGRPGAYATQTVKGKTYNREQAIGTMNGLVNQYISENSPPPGGGGGGGGSSSSGGSTYDPQAAAYYDDQIANANNAVGRIGNQRNIGHSNIDNSFNQAYNKLLGEKAVAERDYGTATTRARDDNTTARGAIYQGIGSTTAGLKRLLGSLGAGNSSASSVMVPYAVGRQGTQQLDETQQKYERNRQNLDTSWGDTKRKFDENQQDLNLQRQQKMNEFDAGLSQTEAGLLEQLASLTIARNQARGQTYSQARNGSQGYTSRVQQLLSEIDNLGRQYATPIMKAESINYTAPELEAYATPNFNVGQSGTSQAPTDVISPYLAALFGKDKKQQTV